VFKFEEKRSYAVSFLLAAISVLLQGPLTNLILNESHDYELRIEPSNKISFGFRELWHYRELFYFFTWRDVKVKYKQTVLGFLWAILQPVILVLIFTFFFNRALHLPSDGIPYSVFAFSGLLLWNIFSSGITNAGNSMVSNAHIIKKVYFPRLIIPISSVIGALFDFMMGLSVFLVMLVFFQVRVNVFELLYCWPIAIGLAFVGTAGMGAHISALNIKYRDFRYLIPFMMQALLFLTPVIYPVGMVQSQWVKYVLAINPMYGAISFFRMPITETQTDPQLITISIVSCIIFFVAGIFYFKRTEMYFADLA
jgi:lipopolysaccharide transport system permease protein